MAFPEGGTVPAGWMTTGGTFSVDTSQYASSPESVALTFSSGSIYANVYTAELALEAGDTLSVKMLASQSGSSTGQFYVEAELKNGSGNFEWQGDMTSLGTMQALRSVGGWETLSFTTTAAGDWRIRVYLSGSGGPDTFYFDDYAGGSGTGPGTSTFSDTVSGALACIGDITDWFISAGGVAVVSGELVVHGPVTDSDGVPTPIETVAGALAISGSITHTAVFSETVSGELYVSSGASVVRQLYSNTVAGYLVVSAETSSVVSYMETVRGALIVRAAVSAVEEIATTWVVNADAAGSTRYANYTFNSFAKIGNDFFGCKSDGIYQLDGDDDAGAPVQAVVSFGKQDFGTQMLKRVTNIYAGTSSGGRLFVKVLVEGQSYLYEARDASGELQVQRFDLGRGIRANYLEFELYNADGDDFDLASVEFAAVPLSRRI